MPNNSSISSPKCAAVNHVEIGQSEMLYRNWKVWLFSGNNVRWLDPHKSEWARTIREACDRAGYDARVDEIVFQ
jgi:hypothetical protein